MEKGICAECNKPLDDIEAMGYHPRCALDMWRRDENEADKNFPFVVVNGNGEELERFDDREEAEEYLDNLHGSRIVNKSKN